MNKIVLIVGLALIVLGLGGALVLQPKKPQVQPIVPKASLSPSGSQAPGQTAESSNWKVVQTYPADQETNVYTGEIAISFTSDFPVNSEKDFSISINPPLQNGWQLVNEYPSNNISAQVIGGLRPKTEYVVVVKNTFSNATFSWTFSSAETTSGVASGLVAEQEKKLTDQYYPLIDFVPFYSDSFDLEYSARLTLDVTIKKAGVSAVKQEVIDWIKTKGVDPATHKINYLEKF